MFDVLWHLRGSVALDCLGPDATVLGRIAQFLEIQRKSLSERGPAHLVFDDPIWRDPFAPGWLALAGYDRGRFWIEHGASGRMLRYDLRRLHGMLFCVSAAGMVVLLGVVGGSIDLGLKIGGLVFAWLYGMNFVVSFFRVPSAIRRVVR